MQLISDNYRDLNSQMHQSRPEYGNGSHRWAETVLDLAKSINTIDVLDYGCGKGALQRSLPTLKVHNYDPAIPGWDEDPDPAKLVVCTDVLEHIEPELLDNVMAHLQEKTILSAMLNISTRPALKTLNDGRNAHLIVETPEWWFGKVSDYFEVLSMNVQPGHDVTFIVRKRGESLASKPEEKVTM